MEDLNHDGDAWLWIKIGKGKAAWKVGNFYREHRIIGEIGSESETEQAKRLEKFIERTKRACRVRNLAITGYFNVNLDNRSMDPRN